MERVSEAVKTSVSIQLTFSAGNSIEDAFEDAVELANKIGCCMEFDFNQINCLAYPGDSAKSGIDDYYKAIKDKRNVVFTRK